tara:strand:+ start:310 stop:963 length:654 start_codon:yes stop_codon:yes gene_type:complete
MEDINVIMPKVKEEIDDDPPLNVVPDEISEAFPKMIDPIPDEDEEIVPEVETKQFLKEEDIFTKHNEITQLVPVVKKVRKKRTMTEESLAKLAIAREKAKESRIRNALLRKEGKLKTKKQVQNDEKLQNIENKRPIVNNVVHKTENITNNITHDDIMRIASETTSKALLSYEESRQMRKVEKKKKYEEEHKKQIIKNTLMNATGRKMGDPGFYSSCF